MRFKLLFTLACLSTIVISCLRHTDKTKDELSALIGREIVIPDSLICRIQDTSISSDMPDADYKIITYVDSAGCIPCRMKLESWVEVIKEYKGVLDVNV